MKRQYTSKRNPCPVCGNHHGCVIADTQPIQLGGGLIPFHFNVDTNGQ